MHFLRREVALGTVLINTFISIASAQSDNTNQACSMGSDAVPGSTIYYSYTDPDDFGAYFQSSGTCDLGSLGVVSLRNSTDTIANCGSFPLDNAIHLIDCGGILRGELPEGSYTIAVDMGVVAAYTNVNIVHNQETETADQPTQTATVTPTSTVTSTAYTTVTKVGIATQKTIIAAAPSSIYTSTFTPAEKTIVLTAITTFTKYIPTHVGTQVTITKITKCVTASIRPVRLSHPRSHWKKRAGEIVELPRIKSANHLFKRQRNQGEGILGISLTTTITPDVTIVTSTADAETTSITVLSRAPDDITVIPANPATTTLYKAAATATVTVTAPRQTSTSTKQTYTLTTKRITTTMTYTATAVVTPVCIFNANPHAVQSVNSKWINGGWGTRRYRGMTAS